MFASYNTNNKEEGKSIKERKHGVRAQHGNGCHSAGNLFPLDPPHHHHHQLLLLLLGLGFIIVGSSIVLVFQSYHCHCGALLVGDEVTGPSLCWK